MHLQRVMAENYSLFDNFEEDNKKKSIEAVQYLAAISAEMRIPFEGLDVLACIGTGKGNQVLTSKTHINKRFFEYTKDFKSTENNTLTVDELATINKECDKIAANLLEQKKKVIKDNINELVDECNEAQRKLSNNFGAIVRYKRELELMGVEKENNYAEIVKKIVGGGWFKFLNCKTVNNQVLMNFTTPHCGWDIPNGRGRADLGEFRVQFNVGNGSVLLFEHKNNTQILGTIFPYGMRTDEGRAPGEVCWGNFGGAFANHFKKGDIEGIFIIVRSMLEQDGGGVYHVDPSYWNPDSNIFNEDYKQAKMVAPELDYLRNLPSFIGRLAKNRTEGVALHNWIEGAYDNYWNDKPEFEKKKFGRAQTLYVYKTKIENQNGPADQKWLDWAAKNPNHRDVTHKE